MMNLLIQNQSLETAPFVGMIEHENIIGVVGGVSPLHMGHQS